MVIYHNRNPFKKNHQQTKCKFRAQWPLNFQSTANCLLHGDSFATAQEDHAHIALHDRLGETETGKRKRNMLKPQ